MISKPKRSCHQHWLNGVLIGLVFGFNVAAFTAPEGSATGSAMAGCAVGFMCLALVQWEITRPATRPARRRRPPAPPSGPAAPGASLRKPQPAGGRVIRTDKPPR